MNERRKILIVEDEATLHRSLSEFLTLEGFEVLSALDGEEALKLADSSMPDLIILDIIIPKKDGYEVLDTLKSQEKTKNIPVILLTNLESPEDIQKALDKGATNYLIKSEYKLEDVVKKIKSII